MKFTSILIVAFSIGAGPETISGSEKDAETTKGREKSVALLRTVPKSGYRGTAGTGFLIERNGEPELWMVTCAHVLEDADAVRVDFSPYDSAMAIEAYIDQAHDLALLRIKGKCPTDAIKFRIREAPTQGLKKGEFNLKMVGFARGLTPVATVPASLHAQMHLKEVGLGENLALPATASLSPETEVLMLGVPGEDGASGSPVIDESGFLIGVYFAAHKSRSDIGYCVSYQYITSLISSKKRPFRNDAEVMSKVANMGNYAAYNTRVVSNQQARDLGANAPWRMAIIEQVHGDQVSKRFFETKDGEFNQEIRRDVQEFLRQSGKKINHAINMPLGCGFLVPEGYELAEKYDEDTKAYTLTISRPGSLYKARIYARRMQPLPNDRDLQAAEFQQETKTFLANVPKLVEMPLGTPATRPEEAAVGPDSWPALYRDASSADLVTYRLYNEPAKGLVHEFMLCLCRKHNRFEVSGISFPETAFVGGAPNEELKELCFILDSIYDTDLGLEQSKQLRDDHSLTPELKLPVPAANAGPNGIPGLQRIVVPIPGTRPQQARQQAQGAPVQAQGAPVQAQGAPVQFVVQRPQINELLAPNLGIHYQLVAFPDGTIGAQLTRNPRIGSPASALVERNGLRASLEKGDTILFLDGVRIQGPIDVVNHVHWTWVDFVDGRTNMRLLLPTYIPALP